MKTVAGVAVLSAAIMLVAIVEIESHQPEKNDLWVHSQNMTFTSEPRLQFHEMTWSEKERCEVVVDFTRSVMRCRLPDNGSFVRTTQ